MYINFWYPIVTSEELGDEKPYQAKVLGCKLVAFRDEEGVAHVVADTCVHRGGSLGKGWLEEGRVVCPYHGWQFGGDGVCQLIPSLHTEEKLPPRAKVDSYPVAEKYGIVFAFLGDLPEEERPPMWEIEEYDQDGWRVNKMEVFEVNYYYERSVENGLDPAHNEFVHPGQGSPQVRRDYRKNPIDFDDAPYGSSFTLLFDRDKAGLMGEDLESSREADGLRAGSGHCGPNHLVTWISFNPTDGFRQYFFEAPIDENHTRIFFINTRSFMLDEDEDEDVMEINMAIANEDVVVVQELNPVRTPNSNTKELLTPSDAPVLRYRNFLKDWENRGWKIDAKAMRDQDGDVAMVIPSPERRTVKGWVLDTVPLIPGENAEM